MNIELDHSGLVSLVCGLDSVVNVYKLMNYLDKCGKRELYTYTGGHLDRFAWNERNVKTLSCKKLLEIYTGAREAGRENKLLFNQTSGPAGDQCCNYTVGTERSCTVEEFLEIILEQRKEEWGEIEIRQNGKTYSVDYSKGKIKGQLPKHILKMKFTEVWSNGGWSRMDYFIELKNNNKNSKEYRKGQQ